MRLSRRYDPSKATPISEDNMDNSVIKASNQDISNLSMISPLIAANDSVWVPKSRPKFKKVDTMFLDIQDPLGFIPIINHIDRLCIYKS
jgi:hypothetical protein